MFQKDLNLGFLIQYNESHDFLNLKLEDRPLNGQMHKILFLLIKPLYLPAKKDQIYSSVNYYRILEHHFHYYNHIYYF